MISSKNSKLIEINWPEFGQGEPMTYAQSISADEFQSRIDRTRSRMDESNLTHLVVFGDR